MKDQKGITLVALIITIIVMLILVAVTISVALNGGLFTNARNARRDTKGSEVREAMALAKAEVLSNYYANTEKGSSHATQTRPTPGDLADLINTYLDGIEVTCSTPVAVTGGISYTVSSTDDDVTAYFTEYAAKDYDKIVFSVWTTP